MSNQYKRGTKKVLVEHIKPIDCIGNKPLPGTGAIGYLRVSTARQNTPDNISIEIQEQRIREYAQRHSIPIKTIFKDVGISGKNLDNRPGLIEALESLARGDTLIVYSCSRLIRNSRYANFLAGEIVSKGIRILTLEEGLDSNNYGWLTLLSMFTAVHSSEIEATSYKIKDAMKAKKLKGEPIGSVNYGYKISPDKKTVIEREEEQVILKRMIKLRKTKVGNSLMQYKDIVIKLNEEGYKNRHGNPWTYSAVYKICAPYMKRDEIDKEYVEGKIEGNAT